LYIKTKVVSIIIVTTRGLGFLEVFCFLLTFRPDEAWKLMLRANPRLDTPMYTKIYQRSLPYFSRDLLNVQRDWAKVGQFCKHLGVLETKFDVEEVYTNDLVPMMGKPSVQSVVPGGIFGKKMEAFA